MRTLIARAGKETATELHELKLQLKDAVKQEDYATAAELKYRIEGLEVQNPITVLQRELDAAVRDERYLDAARLRDELRELQAATAPEVLTQTPTDWPGPTCSDTVTNGLRVRVQSTYVPMQSTPDKNMYVFTYSIEISNEGASVVQLMNRHWRITNSAGTEEHVRGAGVVGKQPILMPGQTFRYSSMCPLRTPYGTMEGSYEMIVLDQAGAMTGTFEAAIGKFWLVKV